MKSMLVFGIFVLAGCGLGLEGNGSKESHERVYALNGVKLISPEITRIDDRSTFSQASYTVAPDRRLLMRFELLSEHVNKIDVDGSNRMYVALATVAAPTPEIQGALRLCPLTKNWMMWATWLYAAPFPGERWSSAGGDIDWAGCSPAVRSTESPNVPPISFDVTAWFVNQARGRGENFGFALIAERSVQIVGDASPTTCPRLVFRSRL